MPFPRKFLNENEDIVLDLHPHWSYFIAPGLALVASIVLAVLAAQREGDVADGLTYAALVLILVSLIWLVVRYVKWATTHFVVTTDRLIHRSGVFTKQGKEIPLERLNDVSFRKTLLERMLGAGDLLIESAGEQGQQEFHNFTHPERVQNEIHRHVELAQARDADRLAGRRELTPLEQLEKLDELRQRGVISQAEFEVKKAQLLDRM
jgi:uncharacterized membrane protein YdbT with pleckstrin-like domain